MSQLVAGQVTGLSTKQITSKKTGKDYTLHYVNVEGFNDRINIGFNAKYAVGSTVSLNVEQKFNEFKEVAEGGATAPAASTPPPAAVRQATAAYPVPADSPENRISNQSAVKSAAEVVAALITSGFIKTDDVAIATVLDMARQINEFTTGRADQAALDGMTQQANVG